MDYQAFLDLQNRQILTFITIARTGSFHEASRTLLVSQPALSKQIKLLEESLGFALFSRSHKGVALTPAGEMFLSGMEDYVKRYSELVERCRSRANEEDKLLRIGYYTNPFIRLSFSLAVADALKRERPDLEIRLVDIPVNGGFEAMREDRIDVFTGFDSNRKGEGGIRFERLKDASMYCVPTADSPLLEKKSVCLEDLYGLDVLLPQYGLFCCIDVIHEALSQRTDTRVEGRIFDNSTIIQAHFAGKTVVSFGEPHHAGNCRTLPMEGPIPPEHGIFYRSGQKEDAVKAFLKAAKILSLEDYPA